MTSTSISHLQRIARAAASRPLPSRAALGPSEPVAPPEPVDPSVSRKAQVLCEALTRAQRTQAQGIVVVGEVLDALRTYPGGPIEEWHLALRVLERESRVQLRPDGPVPPRVIPWLHKSLSPVGPDGRPLLGARVLSRYVPRSMGEIVGYYAVITVEVDHPERRDETLPKAEPGFRVSRADFYPWASSTHVWQWWDRMRTGRATEEDFAAEYVAEIAVGVATSVSWAGWALGPEPRARPAPPFGGW
jgi:hypothetical protein